MIIKSRIHDYEVDITHSFDFLENLNLPNAYYVFDKNVYTLYQNRLGIFPKDRVFLLDALEENKTIDTALEICEKMTTLPTKRNTVLVSFGGGIVQDVTGFVANILYRGIDWIFVPTTLLAACDSCIGGKTSINYKKFKNLLGTFYPPKKIIINPDFFNTLSETDYASGLGEVIKFNVMGGSDNLKRIENDMKGLLSRDASSVNRYVEQSLEFKRLYIEKDEFDKAERILLNFAHTFGHAFEVTSKYAIPHGTAVAIGMSVANRISVQRGILSEHFADSIDSMVRQIVRMPLDRQWFDVSQIVEVIRKDKKQTSDALTAILMDNDFNLRIVKDLNNAEISVSIDIVLDKVLG